MSEHHLILGGGGFIGRHVAILLARAGHIVTIADRTQRDNDFPADVANAIGWRSFDRTATDWDALIADATVIHDYAWSSVPASANADPAHDLKINLDAMLGLMDAMRRKGNGRLIFSSSGGTVYGNIRETPVLEDHPIWPITAYGASKATAEIYMGLYRALYGLDVRIARIANVYGAGQNLAKGVGAITTFAQKALKHETISIWGDGETIRDYIHVTDVASCLVALSAMPKHKEYFVFNVGSGKGTSLNTIIATIENHLGRKLDVEYQPSRSFDVAVNVLSLDRTREVIGWEPNLSVNEGIVLTLQEISSHMHL